MQKASNFYYPAFILLVGLLASCTGSQYTETGKASYYSSKLEGRKMANGEPYRANKLTAAHKTLPFGTKVKVTKPGTNKSVKVEITDRGPFAPGRVIDLSYEAAEKLDLVQEGVAPVKLKVVKAKKVKSKKGK